MNKIRKFFSWLWKKIKNFFPWYASLYRGKAWYVKTLVALVSCIVALIVYLGAVDINFLWLVGKSPGFFSGIMNPHTSEASELYDAQGKLIGKYFNENRTPVKYEEVNPAFFQALISTEDERFYKHIGVDPIGVFAAAKDAFLHHEGRGASTITQQLAKNMFRVRSQYSTGLLGKIPGLRILIVKSKEWIIAMKLEAVYTKKEILTMYANTVDFGSNAYGIKTASKVYFNTTPAELTTEQAAVLVGMLKATTYYSPKSHPENSLARRNVVLNNMVSHGYLSQTACDSLKRLPIKLDFKLEDNYDSQANYFREAVADYLKDWCEEEGYDLYTSGLKIYTTIDTRIQKYAEQAVSKQMQIVQRNFNNHWGNRDPWVDERGQVIPGFIDDIAKRQPFYKALEARFPNDPDSVAYYYKEWKHPVKLFDYKQGTITKEMTSEDSIKYMVHFMHCSFVAMEPATGHVKAWVGDIDFNSWKYDKVTAMRQPGSTFKLFVYTEAMNQGLTPCDKRRDEYISMQVYNKRKHEMETWTPSNANGTFSGDSMPLKGAFARSINSVAVRLGQEMGINRIIETAQKMGIKSPLEDNPSLALGSSDVNLLEMVNSYCTVANDGKHIDPVLVTRILDRDGKEIYVAPTETEQVIPYRSAFLMQQLLQGGMKEPGGTSQSLWGYVGKFRDTDFGGKTGTSNNHSDAWFMGISPKLVVGAWVGGEYRSIHFRTGALGQGSRTALPICGYFWQYLLDDPEFKHYRGKFPPPKEEDVSRDMYICDSYYSKPKVDTTLVDSLTLQQEMLKDARQSLVPEDDVPASVEESHSQATRQEAPPKGKEQEKPTEQIIRLEDL